MSEQNAVDTPSSYGGEGFGGDFGNDFGSDDGNSTGADGVPHGMGQSKSSRRRRRKRKNKAVVGSSEGVSTGEAQSNGAAQTIVMEGESLALAASAAAPVQQPAAHAPQRKQNMQGAGGQQQGQASGKRWKKKFRDRDRDRRPRNENPGNDFRSDNSGGGSFAQSNGGGNYGNGNFNRKNKQGGRKERSFVGPMDHSYREVNGNFADSPPSTIQVHGQGYGGRKGGHRHHGDNQPIDYSMPRPIPIPEGAQTHIYFFIEDLFFTAKIQEAAKKLGVKVAFLKNDKDALAELTSGEGQDKPALIVFDLNNANAKPLTLIPKLKAKLKKSASIVGFLSHLQGDLKAKAVEAGCDTVMPRAAFSQNLPNLLRRYGVEEEEEINYNM